MTIINKTQKIRDKTSKKEDGQNEITEKDAIIAIAAAMIIVLFIIVPPDNLSGSMDLVLFILIRYVLYAAVYHHEPWLSTTIFIYFILD